MSRSRNQKRKQARKRRNASSPKPQRGCSLERVTVDMATLERILDRVKGSLSEEEFRAMHGAFETLLYLTHELGKKRVAVQKLKEMLFGAATEKTREVLKDALKNSEAQARAGEGAPSDKDPDTQKPQPKGHGRNGAEAYQSADRTYVGHESLQPGQACPECGKGKLYKWESGWIVRVSGQAPLGATVYEQEKLRCNLCSKVFSARLPAGVEGPKYDARSAAMIALLKYGSGLPFNRLERLQGSLGIPLPASTQWEIVETACDNFRPAHESLICQAAQGDVVHNDDTAMKILKLSPEDFPDGRTGVFTSGIVATGQQHKIALFFTGCKHAGENLSDLLKRRAAELERPVQMCDALSRNMPEELKTVVGHCLAHGRRKFVEVARSFPEEVAHVLELLGKVYQNDAIARENGLSKEDRLQLHQRDSGPAMAKLQKWMAAQIAERKVEPNSALGEAIGYMQKHWEKLTLFLRQAGAPLDNNICERALKKAILHRKNAYFYKTQNGARVGDLYMSLIHTCELNGANPFEYLTELHRNAKEVATQPERWMPWNYRDTLAAAAAPSTN
jgi:transposase